MERLSTNPFVIYEKMLNQKNAHQKNAYLKNAQPKYMPLVMIFL